MGILFQSRYCDVEIKLKFYRTGLFLFVKVVIIYIILVYDISINVNIYFFLFLKKSMLFIKYLFNNF